jgi:hypothetical protein
LPDISLLISGILNELHMILKWFTLISDICHYADFTYSFLFCYIYLTFPIQQVTSQETSLAANCRRVYAHAHDYHINSISNNRFRHYSWLLWLSSRHASGSILGYPYTKFCKMMMSSEK